jgi:hypothetical protein
MNRSLKARLTLPLILAAATVAGCGPPPPQAPLEQAKKLDESTSGISTACGLTYQVTAFPGGHQPDLAVLEATASSDAKKLASVYALNPKWIYQGETIHTIVELSVAMLHQCGLTGAAGKLVQATGVH